ncbi:HEPN domain-containing protein [Spirulina major CS-329]|uniref:HEPN domain-containing protein n=1 Tax=Spirulina TaxID=1154 RepID=UPI00232D44B6|nr:MULTISPECIES: HEPN domain-containing protein [Spirulina]MDB9494659.1 HEPN domain-containing protein [Spirulina subsalsa CS-330]MDB9503682.1 HEPN domain-containing protein [Spirulina major CS-329]
MNAVQQKFLEKACRSLEAARQMNESGFPEFAVSRAYYTMFYVASAFLEGDRLAYGRHSAIIAAFGKFFAKPERVPRVFHRYLIEAEKLRKGADYGLDIDFTVEEVASVIEQASEMLMFAEAEL